jgi:hypothetical protein
VRRTTASSTDTGARRVYRKPTVDNPKLLCAAKFYNFIPSVRKRSIERILHARHQVADL